MATPAAVCDSEFEEKDGTEEEVEEEFEEEDGVGKEAALFGDCDGTSLPSER